MSIDDLLEDVDFGLTPMPLTPVDTGRFPGATILASDCFAHCRLPEEARAGWLLYAGFASKSHNVSQNLASPEGSYWHAIYHRLEPDPSNAKYWFRQVGQHPIEPSLLGQARAAGWNPGRNWDHAKLVDFIGEAIVSNQEQSIQLAAQIQWIEWRLLFEFCVKDLSQ